MTEQEEREAIAVAVREFEEGGDDAVDEGTVVIEEKKERVHTQKVERSWREVKRELVNQHIDVLRRNIGVAMFRYNHLNVRIPFNERRKLVIQIVAKHQMRDGELLRSRYSIYDDEELH